MFFPHSNVGRLHMKFAYFAHSIVSDWNNGNAHFQRGVLRELVHAGHEVRAFEPADGWSRTNLIDERSNHFMERFETQFPELPVTDYQLASLDLDRALDGVDVVIVHEWNPPELISRLGQKRSHGGGFKLFFHDTHHRSATDPDAMSVYDLDGYDGVLAFGEAVRQNYLKRGWSRRVWTWHEAADTRLFKPIVTDERWGEVVWIGNWGDEERTQELEEFFFKPVKALRLRAQMRGVRVPDEGLAALKEAGIRYGGWVANSDVPELLARFAFTIHIPRRPYREALPGIPTIRVFEALACGIPLISAPWDDTERLFRPEDYLVAANGFAMQQMMRDLLCDPHLARRLAKNGLETVRTKHSCRRRAEELLTICEGLDVRPRSVA
jgi:spore maturation protein CgeB